LAVPATRAPETRRKRWISAAGTNTSWRLGAKDREGSRRKPPRRSRIWRTPEAFMRLAYTSPGGGTQKRCYPFRLVGSKRFARELLEHARGNARVAEVEVEWHQGDAEGLPFPDGSFDAVTSQFGHIFAPRPEVAVAEMLRVLKPGGTVAFATWPPELLIGRMF